MTNHSDPTRSNLLKRFIIFNKNTRYKGSDTRTSTVSKNRRKKPWTSTLFLRLISIRCIFARSTIATLRVVGDQDKSRPHLLLVTSIVSPHLPARGLLALLAYRAGHQAGADSISSSMLWPHIVTFFSHIVGENEYAMLWRSFNVLLVHSFAGSAVRLLLLAGP